MTPKQYEELIKKIEALIPSIEIEEDLSGQIVIYTGLMFNDDETEIIPFEEGEW